MSYYVTVVDGPRVGFLAGPYRTHGGALRAVDDVQRAARQVDDRSAWYEYGTARDRISHNRRGKLNGHLSPGFRPVDDRLP